MTHVCMCTHTHIHTHTHTHTHIPTHTHHRYLALNAGIVYVYFALYQHIDEEEYGGTWELLKEGFMTSYALFLVSKATQSKSMVSQLHLIL